MSRRSMSLGLLILVLVGVVALVAAKLTNDDGKPTPSPARAADDSSAKAPERVGKSSAAITNVIGRHWQLINEGDYEGAYDLFARTFQNRTSRSGWIASKERDRPQSSDLKILRVNVRDSVASATVSLRTVGSDTSATNTGCNDWRGPYRLVRESDGWKIDETRLGIGRRSC